MSPEVSPGRHVGVSPPQKTSGAFGGRLLSVAAAQLRSALRHRRCLPPCPAPTPPAQLGPRVCWGSWEQKAGAIFHFCFTLSTGPKERCSVLWHLPGISHAIFSSGSRSKESPSHLRTLVGCRGPKRRVSPMAPTIVSQRHLSASSLPSTCSPWPLGPSGQPPVRFGEQVPDGFWLFTPTWLCLNLCNGQSLASHTKNLVTNS